MNRCYRLRWSDRDQAWVAVGEHVRGRARRSGGALVAMGAAAVAGSMLLALAGHAHAEPSAAQLPTGAQVAAGQAAVSSQGARMDVQQSSQRAIIDWQSFNVGHGASVNFRQPDAGSVLLNRVLDSQPSQIFGNITANGQVFLSNPNGIYFAPGASVDVGGLVATTHGITNDDFMAGRYRFTRDGSRGGIVNEGTLTAALGGYIALLAPEVRNRGVIIARQGTAALAAGETFELQFDGARTLANVRVAAATIQALVDNGNAVRAPGGYLILSAHGANQVQGSVVHNSGVLEADMLAERNGRIFLDGGAGSISQEGQISATGGKVEVHGGDVYFGQGGTSVANAQGNGGSISVDAGAMLGAVQGHTFDASGGNGANGGQVRLVAGEHADFTLSSSVKANGTGGLVQMSGGAMSLLSAQVSADGGAVNLGGEWQGGGSLPHAGTIKLNGATAVSARGGTISVWSDQGTAMNGALHAEGGKVEVSSAGALQADGPIVAGSVLFDPKNITIGIAEPTRAGTVNLPATPSYDTSRTDTRGFGESFALDGDHLAIGLKSYVATGSTCGSACGAVYLYSGASSANWGSLAFVTRVSNPGTASGAITGVAGSPPSLGTGYADFGAAIALQNGHLAIGAPFYNNFQGGVYLFNYTSGFASVTYATKIDGATPVSGMPALSASERFGSALAFAGNGDKLIVGSNSNAYLFDGLGATPSAIGAMAYRNALAGTASAVAADGDHLAVGASNSVKLYDGLSSANYGSLALRNTLTNTTVPAGTPAITGSDGFGSALALSGDLLYVGAPMSNNEGFGYGRVYVFNGMNSAGMATPGYGSTLKDGAGGLSLGTNYNLGFGLAAASDRVVAGGQANVQLLLMPNASDPAYTLSGATLAYADGGAGASYVVTPADILGYLNAGAAVTLQANNDITVSSPIIASGTTPGGALSLLAGRTLAVNQNITTNNGNLVLSSSTAGAISANTDAGQGQLLIPYPATINIGTGTATLKTDSININGSVTGTGVVNLQPATAGGTVGLVGGAGALNLFSPAIFNTARFNSTLSQLVIGGPNAGDITVGSSYPLNNAVPITLSTPGSIFVTNATVNMGKPLILNADSDASGAGRIAVTGSTISMGANNLVMGGGACTATGCSAPAVGVGGVAAIGVMNDHATITGSGGNLWVWGRGGSAGGDGVTYGFSSVNLGSAGGMTVRGDGSWTPSFTPGDGVAFGSGSVVRAGSGGISVTANGNANTTTGYNGFALYFDQNAKLYTTNGGALAMTVNMDQGNGGNAHMICGTCLLGDASLQNGDISYTWGGTSQLAITMPNVAIPGGNALTLTTTHGITASGTTQSVGGNVTVNSGAGNVALGTSGSFHAGGVTVNTAQNVTVADTGATAVNGIGATGTVSVSAAGNLAVNGAVATTSTSASAITLVAGRGIAAGTAAGGDIAWNSGASLSYGAGGRAILYTGTAGDSALAALAGSGSGRFRYNSTPTASNFTTALTAGANVVARERPTVTIAGDSATKTYDGLAYAGTPGATATGLLNGDTLAMLGGSLSVTGTASGAVNAGSYSVIPGGVTDTRGYAISYANGALTVAQAPLTITANNAGKTYNGLAYSGNNGATYTGFVNGQSVANLTGSLVYGGTAQGAIDAGSYTIAPQGLSSTNYAISYVNGTLTVAQAPLTVTAANANKTYDGLAYSGGNGVGYTGFVNGETVAVLGGTLSYGGTAQGAVNAGNYAISPLGHTSANYAITYVDGSLAVAQAALTVTAANAAKTYDGVAYSGGNGATYTGFVNGETSGVLGGALTYSGTAQGAVNAGSYTITPQGLSSTNYAIQYANGALTVNQAPLALVLDGSVVKTYDGNTAATLGSGNYRLTGLVAGESITIGKSAGTYDSPDAGSGKTVTVALAAGDFTAGAGASLANYVLPKGANGDVGRIDPAQLSVTANNATRNYDGKAFNGGNGVTVSGLVGSDTAASLGTVGYGGDSQGATQVGKYAIVPSGLVNPNYAISYVPGILAIDPALLTIRARDAQQTYSGLPFSGGSGVTYSGFLNGDTAASLQGTLVFGGNSQGAVNAGAYGIVPSGLSSPNYTVAYVNGDLTIRPAALTISANAAVKTYDGKAYTGGNGVSYTGFVNHESASVLAGGLQYGGSSQGAKDAGRYTITPSGLSSQNYVITYADGTLAIGKAALTVSAADASKTYDGKAYMGGNGVSYTGLVNGETAAVLGGSVQYGGGSQGAKDAGSYAITPSGLSSQNYTITYADGTLAIGKAALTVSAADASKTYDGKAYTGGNGVSYAGLVNGETAAVLGGGVQYGGGSQGAKDAGSYAITPSGLSSNNYTITYADGKLEVGKAALTVSAADASKTYDGKAYTGGNGVRYAGLVNGEDASVLGGSVQYGGSSQGAKDAGSYAITPSGLSSNNYTITYADGKLEVGKAALTVSAADASKTYDGKAYAGGNGVRYSGLVNNESPSVLGGSLTYGGSAQGAVNAGSYFIMPQGLSSRNYTITYEQGALTVNRAPLTVTANADRMVYNGTIYVGGNGVVYAGFAGGDTASVLEGTLGYGGSSQGASAAGLYTIHPQGLSSANYTIVYVDSTLTILPPPPVIQAPAPVVPQPLPPALVETGAGAGIAAAAGQPAASDGAGASPALQGGGNNAAGSAVADVGGAASVQQGVTAQVAASSAAPAQAAAAEQGSPASARQSDAATSGSRPSSAGSATRVAQQGNVQAKATGAAPSADSGAGGAATVAALADAGVTVEPAEAGAAIAISASADGTNDGTNDGASGTAGYPAAGGGGPVTIASLQSTLAGAEAPGGAVDAMAANRVGEAVANGMSRGQAEQAGQAFSTALVQQLAQGVPASVASARAERVFQAEASFPAPTPRQAATRGLLANGSDVAGNLAMLSQAKTGAGAQAFDQALAVALGKGLSMDAAVDAARRSAATADSLAASGQRPGAALAAGGLGSAAGRVDRLSEKEQEQLGRLVARGMDLEQALARVEALAHSSRESARRGDANPAAWLANGGLEGIDAAKAEGAFGKVLSSLLAQGMAPEQALARANAADAAAQAGRQADARNPATPLTSGEIALAPASPEFDRALGQALARGATPAQALARARQAAASAPQATPTPATALASGQDVDRLLGAGGSRTFKLALSNALGRGVPVERALAIARQAEQANAFRYPLPPVLLRLAPAGTKVVMATADGKPLPSWLRFDPATRTLVALEVPDGGLPLAVVFTAGGQRIQFTVREGPGPQ